MQHIYQGLSVTIEQSGDNYSLFDAITGEKSAYDG
jgi:hypothetical protein